MSISPSAPEPKESYMYEAASTPRWIFVVFIAAFALIGYLLYAGNDTKTKLETELSKSNSKEAVLAAQIEQTNSVVADLRGKLEVTTQKLGFTQAELSQARTLARARTGAPFRDRDEFRARLPRADAQLGDDEISVQSRYFLVAGRATVGKADVRMQALLERAASALPAILWQRIL